MRRGPRRPVIRGLTWYIEPRRAVPFPSLEEIRVELLQAGRGMNADLEREWTPDFAYAVSLFGYRLSTYSLISWWKAADSSS